MNECMHASKLAWTLADLLISVTSCINSLGARRETRILNVVWIVDRGRIWVLFSVESFHAER